MDTYQIDESYKLSPMQQGILFHYQLYPGSSEYILQIVGTLREEVDITAMQRAWDLVVSRHSSLRTSFRWAGLDEPKQDVHTFCVLPFEVLDWQDLTSSDQQNKLNKLLKNDLQRGFDLTKAPLMRVTFIKFGEVDYRLVWTMHHIVSDGRSRDIVLTEVFAYYDVFIRGDDLQLERPRPYRDYIDFLLDVDTLSSEGYWQGLLNGFTAPTPVDVIPRFEDSIEGREGQQEYEISLSRESTQKLRTSAQQQLVTPNTFVHLAWALLLSRYTGEDDVVFGAVRSGRRMTVEGALSIVGLFVNTLPVRLRILSNKSVSSLLEEIKEQQISVRDHEQTPLIQVKGWSDVPRGMPLFDSIIVFDNFDWNTRLRELGESWMDRDFSFYENSSFPLTLYVIGGEELSLKIAYDTQRFDDGSIKRMLGHLLTILEAMVEDIERPIGSISILMEAEQNQHIQWNGTNVNYPRNICLHELFEEQVERTPDAVAVSFEGEDLTYEEFNRRSNQLAHRLITMGVGPEVLVGVHMERSSEMVIALYGILKAGGAYVPLDPEYPADRIKFMLDDTQVPVLLTQEKLMANPYEHRAQIICLDSDWSTISEENEDNPVCQATAEDTAYVIYTSGSTGRPKGVMNNHRGIVNRILWMQDEYHLTEEDRVLQKTPFSFDVSVWEFFWPLVVGARLIVARPGGHKDSGYLVRLIVEEEVTSMHFVPSMLQLFLEDRDVGLCTSLKRVICSGEALLHELQKRFYAHLNAELHNLYGPTEAAVDVSYWECQRNGSTSSVPIGRPVANTQLYILDEMMQPVPIGVTGELQIGGIQVARGYLNRPELTAEKFIPDPFSDDPGERLYRTGDLTRFLPDGAIEFIGRIDFQVKLRGFRIELGEIESVLSQHPAVREVVVLLREDMPGDKRIAGYIVPQTPSSLNKNELRDYLRDQLPEYMIPAAFVELDTLPLNSNGKVDRRSLPVPGRDRQSEMHYVAPGNELEITIADIWLELLQVEMVGVDDNFFDLGGHSFLIVQAHRRISDVVDMEFSITDMFGYPTVRTLTQYLSQDPGDGEKSMAKESITRAKSRREAMALRHQQRRRARRPDINDGQ